MKMHTLTNDERHALRLDPAALADRLFEAGERIEAQARETPRGPRRAALLTEARHLIGTAADLLAAENARLRAQAQR